MDIIIRISQNLLGNFVAERMFLMKQIRKRAAFLFLIVSVLLFCPVGYAAANGIYIGSGRLEILQNGRSQQTFYLSSSYITVNGESGGLKVSIRERNRENPTQVSFDSPSLTVCGSMAGLELGSALDSRHIITVDAAVGQMMIRGTPQVYIESSSSIDNLIARNSGARLAIRNGAYIGQNNLSAIFSGNISRPQEDASAVYFTVDFDTNGGKNTRYISYDEESNCLYLEALTPDTTLGQAIKDVSFTVRREYNDNKISGIWQWEKGYDSETRSGSYTYFFRPSNSKYDTISVGVNFTNYEDGRRYSTGRTEQYRWDNAQWYGDWDSLDAADNRSWQEKTITVQIPPYVSAGDELELYCNGELVKTYTLSAADAGRQKRYTVKCPAGAVLAFSIQYR